MCIPCDIAQSVPYSRTLYNATGTQIVSIVQSYYAFLPLRVWGWPQAVLACAALLVGAMALVNLAHSDKTPIRRQETVPAGMHTNRLSGPFLSI